MAVDGITGQQFAKKLFQFVRDFTDAKMNKKDILSCTVC